MKDVENTLSDELKEQLNIATLFHGLLFAYQKTARNILGSGSEVFVQPTLDILARISEKQDSWLFKHHSMEEAANAFLNMLLKAKAIKSFCFKKTGREKYVLNIDGCVWAKHIHKELQPRDATCPYALVIMAIYRKYSGEKVEETESRYMEEGTETEIRPLFAAPASLETGILEMNSNQPLKNKS